MYAFYLMEPLLKVFWVVAAVSSLVFIIQTVMTFIGLGADTDIDAGPADMDSVSDFTEDGGLNGVFSFRNLINFLLGYGWAGVLFYDSISKGWLLQLVAILTGLIFVAAFVVMFRALMKLSHDGSFHVEETLGLKADVYLRIPSHRQGRGKVQVSVKGSVHEIDAVTDADHIIPTGGNVTVKEVLAQDLLLVE